MNNVWWLIRFASRSRGVLAASILARVAGQILGALTLAVPAWAVGSMVLSRTTVDSEGSQGVTPTWVWAVIAAVAAMALIKACLRYVEQYLGHLAAFRLLGQLRIWIVERLIPQVPAVTDGLGTARVHSIAIRDVDRVEVFFAHTIAPAITAVLIPAAATMTALVAAGPSPALVLAATFVLGYVIALSGASKASAEAAAMTATRAEIAQHIGDTLRLREELFTFGAVSHRMAGLRELDHNLAQNMQASGHRAGLRAGATALRQWGGTIAVFYAGLPAISADVRALPGVLIATSLVAGTSAAMDSIERLASSLPAGLHAVTRIRTLAAGSPAVVEPETPQHVAAAPSDSGAYALELKEVSYRYPTAQVAAGGNSAEESADDEVPAAPVVEDISLAVRPGAFVGVVGPTGSGKSTLARLIQRHVDPDSGSVIIHGRDARELGSENVYRTVVVADQSPFLIEGTVADNLRLGAPRGCEADEPLMRWALRLAVIDPTEMPLDRPIGRRGQALSGGQRQRLALARTYVSAALADGHAERNLSGKIVIFDEATSHQDPLTQRRIVDNARTCGASCIFIAHRLETLRDADDILVIDSGHLVERGGYKELLAAGGAFTALAQAAEMR